MDNYNEEDVQWLYGRMVDDGVDAGTIDDFKESLKNDADRDWYYKRAKKMGLDVGDADEFRSWTVPDDTDDEADDFDTEVGQAVDSNNRMTGHIPEDMQDASWNYQNYGQKYNGPGGQAMFTDEELAEQIAATRDANQPTANAVDTSGTTWLNSDVERGYISGKRENPNKGATYQQKESWTGSYARTPDEFGEMHYGWQRGERVKRLNKQGLEFAGYGGHKGNQYYNEALDAAEQMSDDEIVATYDQISKAIGPNTDYKWFVNTDEGYRTASQLKALQHELHARDLGFAHDRDVENPGMEDYASVRTDKAVADLIDSMGNMSQQERDAMAQAAYDRGLGGEGMSIEDQNTMLAVAAIRSRENGRRVEDNYRELQQQVEYGSLYSTLERDMDKIFSEEKGAMVQREEDAVGDMVYAGGEGSELAWANARTIEAIKAGNLPETFNTMTNRLINESEAARRYVNRRVGELSKQVGILQARAMARDELRQMFRTKYIEGNPLTPKSDAQYIVQTVLLDNMWSKMNQASMGLAASAPYHEMKATIDEGMQMYAQHEASTAARIIAPCAVLVFDAATGSFMPASYAAKGATALYGKGVNKAISWLGNRLFGIGSEMAIRRAGENTALRILGSAIGGAANFATYEFESELFGGTASGNLSAGNLAHAAVGGAGKGFVFGFVGGVAGKATEGLTGMGALLGEVGTIAAEGTTFTAMDYLQTGQLTPESIGTSFGMAIAGRMAHPAEYASNLLGRVVGLNAKNAPSKPPRISKEMAARLQNEYPTLTALLSGDGLAKDIVKSFKGSAIDKQDAGSRLDAIEEEYRRLKFDSNVPWSVVRIAEYVVQGRVIPQPWMMNSDIRTDENGNEYGVTLDGDGRVIEEFKFKNENERDKWRAYTSRQSDINRLNVAAQNMRRSEFTDILESTINEVADAQGMDANALRDVVMGGDLRDKKYRKSVKDKAYLQSADDVQKAVDSKLKATESPVDVAIRAVENKYGISIEQALEYPVYQRTEREAKAVEELQQRLNGEYAPENDMSDAEIIEAEKAEAHDEGFNAEGEERANLKERLEDAANALGEMSINPADIDGMDDAALAQWMQEREMDSETAAAVMEYQNAKAAFEGIRDRVQDEAGKRIEESNRQTDECTNPDTNSIHPVKMNEGGESGRDAFVIGGKIVINQDGTVNRAQSDESITVLYPDTGEKKVKTITDIKSGEPTIDPEQAKQEAAQQITEEVAGQAADDMNRALPFNVGDTYDVMKGGVVPEKVTVIGLDANGDPILQDSKGELVNREVDEQGNPVGVDRDWVQQMADQYREAMRNGKGQEPRQSRDMADRPAEQQGEPAPAEGRPAERAERPAEEPFKMPMTGEKKPDWEKATPEQAYDYLKDLGDEDIETIIRNNIQKAMAEADKARNSDDVEGLKRARAKLQYWDAVDNLHRQAKGEVVIPEAQIEERPAEEPENSRPEQRTSLGGQEAERPAAQPVVQPAQERRPVQQLPAEQWRPSGVDEREVRKERPAGFSEEDKRFWSREGDDIVEVMDQAAKDMGLAVATYDDPNGENGYIQGGVIYLNSAKGRAAVGFVMGHEMTHEMQRRDQKDGEDGKKEDGDRYKRFRDLALQYAEKIYTPTRVNGVRCDTYEDYLKARLDLYQDHIRETTRNRVFQENWDAGMDNDSAMAIADREAEAAANAFTMDDLKNEVTADTAGMFLDDADMARKILGQEQDLSWLQRQKEALMEWLEKKLAQLTGHGEEYKKMKELQQSLQDIYQEAVRKGRGDQTQDQAIRFSLDTMANQFGLRYEKGADGKTHFYEDYGRDKEGNPIRGREITKFMPVHIERSPVGAVLRQGLKDGFIDEEQYNRTIANQCAIMQYMKDTDNLDQFFAVSGAIGFAQLPTDAKEIQRDYYKIDTQGRVAFTPYVSNSETQYATSFDVTTICRKTQTMIDVMCETMKRQHHGLTADEVVKIVYDNVYKLGKGRNDGGDVLVPCDVCYVFNRWVNLGKVFDTMRRMRDTYSDMSIEDIRKEREKTVTDLCDYYRVSGNTEEYQTYKDYVDARARYDAMKPKDRKTDEGKDLAKSLKKFDAAMKDAMVKRQQAVAEEIDKLNWKIFNYEHLLKKDPAYKPTAKDMKRLEELQRELDYLDKGTWFDYVRLQDDYTPIPDEVLFDMNKSYEFKENYPGAWKYRTTRGPNAGKAAAAYSPQYFGNGIVGASKSATSGPEVIQDLSNNVFLAREEGADGKWHYKYIDEETWTLKPEAVVVLRKAQDNAAAQNYLGGQRFQSTSDTRTEYLTDYNTFMLEQMAIGSKGQGFTKVPECAKLFGDTGTMFNLSLIAKGKGYEELTPAQYKALSEEDKRDCAVIDGKILHALYSDVSGINHRDAFKLNDYYPNLQPIMVCINRTHTRLMMVLAKQGRVPFNIPYHASGDSTDRFLSKAATVGDDVDMESRDDYEPYQNDLVIDPKDKQTAMVRDVFVKIKTGADFTDAEMAYLRGLDHDNVIRQLYMRFRGEDVDGRPARILNKYLLKDDRDTAGEGYGAFDSQCRVKAYDSKTGEYLKDENGNFIYKQVKLNSRQAALLMPNDYWDKTISRDRSDENGQAFLDLCAQQGLYPRFGGWKNVQGKRVYSPDHDFTKEPGYYSTLIDISMYNNDGSPVEHKAIDASAIGDGHFIKEKMTQLGDYKLSELGGNPKLSHPALQDAVYKSVMDVAANRAKETIAFAKQVKAMRESGESVKSVITDDTPSWIESEWRNNPAFVREVARLSAMSDKQLAAWERRRMQEAENNATAAPGDGEVHYSLREEDPPKKTIKVYKLFNVFPKGHPHAGEPMTLFIDSNQPLQRGVWLNADAPSVENLEGLEPGFAYLMDADGNVLDTKQVKRSGNKISGLPGKTQVYQASQDGCRWITVTLDADGAKSYHNVGINGSGSPSAYAMRPGWYATDVPSARHIGEGKDGGNAVYRRSNQRWFEAEIAADNDYNEEARSRYAQLHPKMKREDIDANLKGDIPERIPKDGYYNFKTNSNANPNQSWYIAGAMKIGRPLSEAEARRLAEEKGVEPDLPYKDGVKDFDEEDFNPDGPQGGGRVSNVTNENAPFSGEERERHIADANAMQKTASVIENNSRLLDVDASDIRFSLSNATSKTIDSWFSKREDLTPEQKKAVKEYLNEFDDKKLQLSAARWFVNGTVRLPEDMPKVEQAVQVANKVKVDPLQYSSPMELINQFPQTKIKAKPIDPEAVPTLRNGRDIGHGIRIYDVEESEESRQNMRQIINTHFGEDASPWCLLQGDGHGNLTVESRDYWDSYDAYPKRVAFKDGKLIAFSANDYDEITWWDRMDEPHRGIKIEETVPNDKLGRKKTAMIDADDGTVSYDSDNMFRGNKQNGTYEEWDSNGVLIVREQYKDGKEDGISEVYDSNGDITSRTSHKEGKLDGLSEDFYQNGKVRSRRTFKDGELDGLCESFWPDGKRKIRQYKKGRWSVGDYEEWYDNGQLKDIRHYDAHYNEIGVWLEYNQDGQIIERTDYSGGKKNRVFEQYDSKDGKVHRAYYRNGLIEEMETWNNGILEKHDEWSDSENRFAPTDKKPGLPPEGFPGESNVRFSLSDEQREAQTHSANFKRWFGDWENDPKHASKVVDENGEPLVVYHGTDADFTIFDISKSGSNTGDTGFYGRGFYFSDKELTASAYGESLLPVYLDIKNPFYADRFEELYADMIPLTDFGYPKGYTLADYQREIAEIADSRIEQIVIEDNDFGRGKKYYVGVRDKENEHYFGALQKRIDESEVQDYLSGKKVAEGLKQAAAERILEDRHPGIKQTGQFLLREFPADTLAKVFNEYGFDGVIGSGTNMWDFGAKEYVVFNPTQIKSATENNGDFSRENPDIRYSLKEDEERTLMGMHNISAEKLRSALKLGGLANPSMAVINTEVGGFTNFGEISLIPSADLIASRTGDNAGTWGADAYSPRFPETHRRLGKGGDKKMRSWVKGLKMRQEMEYNTEEQFNDYYNGFNIRDNALVYPFLHEKGLSGEVDYYTHMNVDQRLEDDLREANGDQWALLKRFDEDDAYKQKLTDIVVGDEVGKIRKKDGETFQEFRDRRREWAKQIRDGLTGEDGFINRNLADDLLYAQARAYRENGKFSESRTRDNAEQYIHDHGMEEEYQQYFEQKMQELGAETQIYAGSDSQGRSKFKAADLDQVSRQMKKQGRAGGEGGIFADSPGAIRAKLLTPMKTLDQIRKQKGRIVDHEQFEKAREDYQNELREYADTYARGSIGALADILTSRNMQATAKQYNIDLDADAVADLNGFKDRVRALPTEYFETKFERPVMLNEFKKAVVPDDLPSDIRKALEDAGLDVVEYPAGDNTARERVTLDAVKNDDSIRFSLGDTFYSNAAHAVEGVKQEKAKAEQWKAMLTKAGGIKAGEDKWMGLSTWLDEHKGETLTKDEVRQFVADNGIEMEETHYSEYPYQRKFEELSSEFDMLFEKRLEQNGKNGQYRDFTAADKAFYDMVEKYGADFDSSFDYKVMSGRQRLSYKETYDGHMATSAKRFLGAYDTSNEDNAAIESTRLYYTTKGLNNKREIAFVVPGIEPYQEHDETHFGPENQGRAVMWVRFGETTDTDGNRVLVIDEVQSNRHQDAREKGYWNTPEEKRAIGAIEKEIAEIEQRRLEILEPIINSEKFKGHISKDGDDGDYMWDEFKKERQQLPGYSEIDSRLDELYREKGRLSHRFGPGRIPAAPFEKNWHEVAMKRMLRLAAEEGFDKVAWTTGEQQASRYGLGTMVKKIESTGWIDAKSYWDGAQLKPSNDADALKEIWLTANNEAWDGNFIVGRDGIVKDAFTDVDYFTGKPLSDLVGKELAEKLLDDKPATLEGDNLQVGGAGMRAFYDGMLPQFMNKYGKRWGVKVGEVTLDTPGGETMHSVDVNEDMKRSVMQGQPLFSLGAPYQGSKNKIAKDIVDILPRGERFVDLFSGGGAVTHAAMLSDKFGTFHMNDINPVGQRGFVSGMNGEWENYDRTISTPEEFDQVRGTMEGIIHSHNYYGRNVARDNGAHARAGINRMKSLGTLKPYADRLTTTETDYRDVELRPGDVVYADIPYENTDKRGYGEPRFDKGEFVEWAQEQDVPVFVSEYTMPDGWTEIGSFTVRGARGGHREEKLWVQDKFADQYGGNATTHGTSSEGPRYQLSEDIENYRLRDVSWERSMLDHLMETAGRNREAVDKRRDALRTLNSQAGALRKAMSKQRAYDRWTVDDLVSMAKSMLKSGLYKDMSPYEVSRLVGMINQGAGREDITRQANSVFDMMMKHHVKEWRNQFNKLLMVRENRIDKNGVRVQGALDPQGQRMVKALRGALGFDEDTLNDRILDCRDRMGSDDPVVAGNAIDEYEGLMLAQQHYDTVGRLTKALEELQHERRVQLERVYEYWREERLGDYGNVIYRQDGLPSTVEKHRLRPEFGGLGEDGNRMPVSDENKAIRKQVDATVSRIEQAMRETEVELAEGYRSLCDNVGGSVAASITRAKEWVESEKERVSGIQHAANSDLLNTEEKLSGMDRSKEKGIANNAVVRFINSPLGSFEKFMRYFGQRSAYGEGRLFNKFMRGHSDCTDAEWRAYKEGLDAMNRKSDELFGCSWEELMVKMRGGAFANTKDKLGFEREFPPVEVSYWVDGKRVDDTLNQDEVAYLIACSKMTDGMMKLENMGIDEAMIEQLRQQVDPKMLELADWYQGEFLPKQRARINEVYRRMFGADMAHIDNYIHLNINQRGLNENKDINQRMAVSETPSTITGSLKERKRNVKPIDLHTSLLDLAMEEHQKMENWIAWAEYNRDLKDLLNYKKFKNKVVNMKSVELGSGEQLWDKFTKTVAVVTGDFQGGGKHSEMDRFATNAAKFVSSGCINFRVHTALKQVLSFPAFMSDARPGDILHAAGNAMGSVQWAMENLPGFSKRWQSRRVGDTRLMDTDSDYSFWRNRWVQKVNKAGMTANASVDCLTVAIGARAVYETAKRRCLSYGYTEAQAERKALQDAYVSYNSSQQSSEGAFVSPMQVERTFLSAIGTTFRNASMGYERRVTTGARNLARMLKKGYKEDMIENTKKQMMEEGLTEEQAQRAAERVYNRQVWHSMMDVANFGYALPFLWILGPTLSYLLAGDDKDIKEDTLADLARHAMFGPIEGLTFGGVMSELGNMVLNNRVQGNEWKDLWKELKYKDLTPLPLVSRMQGLVKSFGKGWWEGINDLAGLLIQSNIGVDPNTLTDAGVAILDACNGDLDLSKEVALGLMRILQFPQSQIDNLYIDELGLKGEDLGKYSYEELARRYAHYKTSRAVLPSAMREDDANQEAEDKMVERFEEKVQERIATMDEEQLRRTFDSNDPDLKKMAGKQMAKNAGLDNEKFSKAPASNATERTARAHTTYQRIRSYADMAEDLLLESAQNKAKESGDEERKDAISKARKKLNAIINGEDAKGSKSEVKGLGQGEDKKVMERLREERKKVLKELKITR